MSATMTGKVDKMLNMVIVTDRAREVFGERLKKWREAKGKTQQDLAYELGCSMAAISKWERADKFPRALNIKRALKEQTGLDVDAIARKHAEK